MITKGEAHELLKIFSSGKSPGLDGVPYEYYFVFVSHVCFDLDSGFQQLIPVETVPDWISRSVITLLKKDKHGGRDFFMTTGP